MREQIDEKADTRCLRIFSLISYTICLIGFALLVSSESQKFVTETEIKPIDLTGTDSWTCEMISKSNQAFTIDDTTEPTQNYYLVNVMETPAMMTSNLIAADPCSSPEFYAGTSAPYNFQGDGAKFIAYSPNGTLVVMFQGGSQTYLFRYDDDGTANGGEVSSGSASVFSALAVDADNQVWVVQLYLGVYEFLNLGQFLSAGDDDDDAAYGDDDSLPAPPSVDTKPYMFVDNLNNLYYLLIDSSICTVYSIKKGATAYEAALVWTYTCNQAKGDYMYSAAYNYGTGDETIVYYGVTTDSTTLVATFMMYENGVVTNVFDNTDLEEVSNYHNYPMLAVDENRTIYYGWGDAVERYVQTSGYSTMPAVGGPVLNLVFNPSHSTLALGVDLPYVLFFDMASSTTEYLNKMNGFGMSWFTCGTGLVSPIPADSSSFALGCKDNGVVGSTLLMNDYFFTTPSAAIYAANVSAPLCSSYAASVITTTKDLPPYSCERKVYPTFFAIMGAAVANTQLLLAIVVALFAFSLDKLAHRFPAEPKEGHWHDDDKAKDLEAEGGLEMKNTVDTSNPLHAKANEGGMVTQAMMESLLDERVKLLQPPAPLPEKTWKYFKKDTESLDTESKVKMRTILAANQDNIAAAYVSGSDEERRALLEQLSLREV